MINNEANEVIKNIHSHKNKYQNNLIKGSQFVFKYVHLLYHKYYKINLNCGSSYIDSPDWIKETINPINKRDN